MATIVKRNVVKREKGKLYFIDGKGNVCSAAMKRGKKKATPKRKPAKKAARKSTGKRRTTKRK